MTDPSIRNCYCSLWETKPEFLPSQGVPPGFCGICDRCGKPGHTRHAPNGMPYTAAWCDRCYTITRFTQPVLLWVIVYGGIAALVVFLLTR